MKRKHLPSLTPVANIRIGAPDRLRVLRAYVAAWNAPGSGYNSPLESWRVARGFCNSIALRSGSPTSGRWAPDHEGAPRGRPFYSDAFPFDVVGDATDRNIALNGYGPGATGYYCDSQYWETAIPVVCKYRRKEMHGEERTHVVYVPGVRFTEGDGVTCYPLDVYENQRDAMRAAHSYAERIAESERKSDAEQRAEDDIEEARDAIKEARAAVHALIVDLKSTGALPAALCGAIAARIKEERRAVWSALKTIKERRRNPWSAVENY